MSQALDRRVEPSSNGLSFTASKYLGIFDQFKAVYSGEKKQIETKLGQNL